MRGGKLTTHISSQLGRTVLQEGSQQVLDERQSQNLREQIGGRDDENTEQNLHSPGSLDDEEDSKQQESDDQYL